MQVHGDYENLNMETTFDIRLINTRIYIITG